MAWFKVDDKLHAHRKSRKAGKAAIGVWVLAGSWSMDNDTDGFIPKEVLPLFGNLSDAKRLVSAELWIEDQHEGEQGFRFRDWDHYQPSAAVTAARKAKERESGLRGNHQRWHVDRKVTDPDCEFCYRVPDGPPDQVPDSPPESGQRRPVPVPVPHTSSNEDVGREDVERICEHLASSVEHRGVKRPAITKQWRTAARLLMDRDGYTEQQIRWLIDQSAADQFWSSNVLSMPKLRAKADQLKLKFRGSSPATDQPSRPTALRQCDAPAPHERHRWEDAHNRYFCQGEQ